ncbi:MAG: recombinase family protein, partial [Nitrososphaera sp.]|nr:recombinase family protein [Nitrososphaera sp.]
MTERDKIKQTHLSRNAMIYIRQSTVAQVERNRESTDRQYRLVERALELGWKRHQVVVVDEDLGCTGSGAVERLGFNRMASDVGLGRVGIIISLEASRLSRNNSDWYHLLDLAGITDTLIADTDGVYHPREFNDRLLLGLKGTMSEAEHHLIRARLNGGIKNKAARGKLRCPVPVGYVWSEDGEEVKLHPDESISGAIRNVFERFAELGSARQVWLWFCAEGLQFPKQHRTGQIEWGQARYWQMKEILTNPVYAGVYAYGKSRRQGSVDSAGRIRYRVQHLPQEEWQVFIRDHHEGYIGWET